MDYEYSARLFEENSVLEQHTFFVVDAFLWFMESLARGKEKYKFFIWCRQESSITSTRHLNLLVFLKKNSHDLQFAPVQAQWAVGLVLEQVEFTACFPEHRRTTRVCGVLRTLSAKRRFTLKCTLQCGMLSRRVQMAGPNFKKVGVQFLDTKVELSFSPKTDSSSL